MESIRDNIVENRNYDEPINYRDIEPDVAMAEFIIDAIKDNAAQLTNQSNPPPRPLKSQWKSGPRDSPEEVLEDYHENVDVFVEWRYLCDHQPPLESYTTSLTDLAGINTSSLVPNSLARSLDNHDREFWRANIRVSRQIINRLHVITNHVLSGQREHLSATDQVWVTELAQLADRLLHDCADLSGLRPRDDTLYAESERLATEFRSLIETLVEQDIAYDLSLYSDIFEFPVAERYSDSLYAH